MSRGNYSYNRQKSTKQLNKMKKRLFKFLNNTNETLDFSDILTLFAFTLAISVGLLLLLIIEQSITNF